MADWVDKVKAEINRTKLRPNTFVLHPQQYRDLVYGAKLLEWAEKTNWLERWVAYLFCFETIRYEDFSEQIEKNIEEMYRRQAAERPTFEERIRLIRGDEG